MPMLPQQWHNSVAQVSLAPPVIAPEHYEELWWYSGATSSTTYNNSGSYPPLLAKGTNAATSSAPQSSNKLLTLNASWSPATKFAFEVTLYGSSATSGTYYAALYDITAGAIVAASQVSTTSTTATVFRSGQFTLTPGHVYGVNFWVVLSSGTPYCYLTDASLIIFS